MRRLVLFLVALFTVLLTAWECHAAWPEALLPPGVRMENGPPGGMTFPVLLAETILPLTGDTDSGQLPPVQLCFSPDGKKLAIGFDDGIRVIEVYKNREAWRSGDPDLMKNIRALSFTADGESLCAVVAADVPKLLITSASEYKVNVWRELGADKLPAGIGLIAVGKHAVMAFAPAGSDRAYPGLLKVFKTSKEKEEFDLAALTRLEEGHVLLSADSAREAIAVLTARRDLNAAGQLDYRVTYCPVGKDPSHSVSSYLLQPPAGAETPAGTLSLLRGSSSYALAVRGRDPFVVDTAVKDQEPAVLNVGNGHFLYAQAGSAQAVAFMGSLAARGEKLETGAEPNALAVLNPGTKEKWYLPGTFVPGAMAVSDNGRWIAALAQEVPARGPRGRGLILLDNQLPGSGDKKIAYTYTTKAVPPGPLVMAGDGSALAFVEYDKDHKKAGGPALVVNVIR